MLSFEKLTEKDQALAWGYDNEEGVGTPDFTVWYTPRYKGKTAITSSDVLGLLSSERLVMQSIYGLTRSRVDDPVSQGPEQRAGGPGLGARAEAGISGA